MANSSSGTVTSIGSGYSQGMSGGRATESAGGSGGGGGDAYTLLALVDAKVAAGEDRVMLQVAKETTELERQLSAQITGIEKKLGEFRPGASWQQIAGIAFALLTAIFAILAFASDRFDSGVSSMGAIEEALDTQREANAAQNERIDRIISAIEALNSKRGTSSPAD